MILPKCHLSSFYLPSSNLKLEVQWCDVQPHSLTSGPASTPAFPRPRLFWLIQGSRRTCVSLDRLHSQPTGIYTTLSIAYVFLWRWFVVWFVLRNVSFAVVLYFRFIVHESLSMWYVQLIQVMLSFSIVLMFSK